MFLVLVAIMAGASAYSVTPRSPKDVTISKLMRGASVLLPITGYALVANAGFFESDEQGFVNDISKYQAPIADLLDQLRPMVTPNAVGVYAKQQVLKGGKEDSDVVLNYLEGYIKPCQLKMASSASKLKLENTEAQSRLEILPNLMKGHIFELQQAIIEQKAESQAREVQEVQETLAEFLKLASSKYAVVPYIPVRPLSDKELFGPLGCEFWGKQRVPGSNACFTPEPKQ
jgi:hypothetical protein